MYMSVLTVPWIFIADTRTNQVIGKAGPFGKGIRPFVVSNDEKYVYANVDWLLGFEVAEGKTDKGLGWQSAASRRVAYARVASCTDAEPSRAKTA